MSAMPTKPTFVSLKSPIVEQLQFALSRSSINWMIAEIGGDLKVQQVVSGQVTVILE